MTMELVVAPPAKYLQSMTLTDEKRLTLPCTAAGCQPHRQVLVLSQGGGPHIPDATNEVAVADAGCGKEHTLAGAEICCVQYFVKVITLINCTLPLVVVTRPQPALLTAMRHSPVSG